MIWNDIPTGDLIVWLNNLGEIIPWLNDFGTAIPWYAGESRFVYVLWVNGASLPVSWINGLGETVTWGGAVIYAWQQISTFQVPRWGEIILRWKNDNSIILGWSNNSGTQLKWRSNQLTPQPFNEPNAFWTVVPT
jgi:hypothetical protein